MNQNLRKYIFIALCVGLFYPTVSWGAAVWDDVTPPTSVTDQDLIIAGTDIELPLCETFIKASTTNVIVTVTATSIIRGNDAGPSQLFIHAEAGLSVTFVLDNNLTFVGSADGVPTPLLIVASGLGTIFFELADGTVLNLISGLPTSGGTQFYLMMDNDPAGVPTVEFQRKAFAGAESGDVSIQIGTDSFISYLADTVISCTGGQTGIIRFNPTNNGTGAMNVTMQDRGGLIVEGVHFTTTETCTATVDPEIDFITLEGIDRTVAAGCRAIMEVVNDQAGDPSYFGSFIVLSFNNTLFDLLSDPYYNLGTRTDNAPAFACDPVYKGSYNGLRYSLVLGANGQLDIQDSACVKYIGLTNDMCPTVTGVPGHEGEAPSALFKQRNPSAFWVDGNNNPDALTAKINLGNCSGLFFASGVGSDGSISNDLSVAPDLLTAGAGEYVFIVEGPLNVFGQNTVACPTDCQASKIEILSLLVTATGSTLFCDNNCCEALGFPRRLFATNGDACDPVYLTFNKGAFLINNYMNLYSTSLSHTDVSHKVYENDDCKSEPTYVGGETWWLEPAPTFTLIPTDGCPIACPTLSQRPRISFINSRLNVNTNIASTGLDWTVPNNVAACTDECADEPICTNACLPNISRMVFYYNGKRIDQGTGRQMILGTFVGATTCDGCTVVSRDSHLDVMQTATCLYDILQSSTFCPESCALKPDHKLFLQVAPNNACINENIVCDITSQLEMHNIYLGGDSNITIGTDLTASVSCAFSCPSCPEFLIKGNYFSITSKGGALCNPSTSSITGKGGIFVDSNGTLSICPQYRASIGAMVTRSGNGVINLPQEQVIFTNGTGISAWKVNLAEPDQQVLVRSDEIISEYIFNWIAAKKDYSLTCSGGFVPYNIPDFTVCNSPIITQENVTGLPTIQGTVDQFFIQGARIGDEPQIMVDGGHIRELLFYPTAHAGDAPVAVMVLKNSGRVGVNMEKPNPLTLFSATTFGINGITIIADGNAVVDLNDDMIISSRCAFLKGPNFNNATDRLTICSEVERVLLVKSTGILDLQSFNDPADVVDFCGQIRIILEPGARVVMGGGTYQFSNEVQVVADPFEGAQAFFRNIGVITPDPTGLNPDYTATVTHGAGLGNTDSFRVKLIGTGTMLFVDNSQLLIDKDSFVGVETFTSQVNFEDYAACFCPPDQITPMCEISTTSLTIELRDNALFSIGGDRVPEGGSFQVGNTAPRAGHEVHFRLLLNGIDTQFINGTQGFFGLNVGIVDRQNLRPNDWLVDVMYNVQAAEIISIDGLFQHSFIFPGNDLQAHLFAIGESETSSLPLFTFFYENAETVEDRRLSNANIKGGGNFIYLEAPDTGRAGYYKPIVLDLNDITPNPNMRVSILSSLLLLANPSQTNTPVFADELFDNFETTDVYSEQRSLNKGNASTASAEFSGVTTELRVGWVLSDLIGRQGVFDVIDTNGGSPAERIVTANDNGAVVVGLDPDAPAPSTLVYATQIQS